MKTKVKFLVHPDPEDDIFAIFPEDMHNELVYGDTMLTSYSHEGQHSACHIDYANESREATEKEYTPLKEELESLGYKFEILNK